MLLFSLPPFDAMIIDTPCRLYCLFFAAIFSLLTSAAAFIDYIIAARHELITPPAPFRAAAAMILFFAKHFDVAALIFSLLLR